MSSQTRVPWCGQKFRKVEIGFSLHDETGIAELNELLDDS